MASAKERPSNTFEILNNLITEHFPPLKTPKNDTRAEDHQEGRQKEKKRRDDEK